MWNAPVHPVVTGLSGEAPGQPVAIGYLHKYFSINLIFYVSSSVFYFLVSQQPTPLLKHNWAVDVTWQNKKVWRNSGLEVQMLNYILGSAGGVASSGIAFCFSFFKVNWCRFHKAGNTPGCMLYFCLETFWVSSLQSFSQRACSWLQLR